MFTDYRVETVNINQPKEYHEIEAFLARFGLTFDRDLEYTVAVRSGEALLGTGSFAGEVLRNIAVEETAQGGGLTALIVSSLMQEQARRGRMHYFLFTKPEKAAFFTSLGFTEIARAEPYAALLETGLGSVESYAAAIARTTAHLPPRRAAVVVNCNPFTRGHQSLIEKAAAENPSVIVFVVSEDKSLFPFEHRLKLVKAGTAHLPNVAVVETGKYMVSAATFPTYFTREADKASAQTRLDITLFAKQIAPHLDIRVRYVGHEPYCAITNCYNEAMQELLTANGIELRIMERVQVDNEIISASKVRDMIRQDDWEGIRKAVPDTTYQYLLSPEAAPVLEKIRASSSRH